MDEQAGALFDAGSARNRVGTLSRRESGESMSNGLEAARARARKAREEYEDFLRDREASRASEKAREETDQFLRDLHASRERAKAGGGGTNKEPPSASPTTFSDCASLQERAGQEWALAAKLGQMGYTTQAAEHSATAGDLDAAAASCSDSASGLIIEL